MLKLNNIDFKQLETKGFLVIPQFLDSIEVQLFFEYYTEAKARKDAAAVKNKNASVSFSPTPLFAKEKIDTLLKEVSAVTNLSVNFVYPSSTYFDSNYVQFGWHQDHDTYYMWQDSYNLLNCWIPIVKPDHDKSGLSVIPYDAIMPLLPEIAKDRLIGKGAKLFLTKDNKTVIRDDSVGDTISLDFNIEDYKQTPSIRAGDLLLLRGDVIHKTQDISTARIAVSIRSCNADYMLSKEVFYNQCSKKKLTVENDTRGYKIFHDNFAATDFVAVREMFKK